MTDRIGSAITSRSLNMTEALAGLMMYASEHFHTEETLMRRIGYPELPLHRLGHAAFERQLMCFALQIHAASYQDWDRLATLATNWMSNHVLTGDMDIRRYVLHSR